MRSPHHATRLRSLLSLFGAIALGAGCGDPGAGDGAVAQTSEALLGNDQTSYNYWRSSRS